MTPTIITSVPLTVLVLIGIGAPMLLLALLGSVALLNRSLPERWTAAAAGIAMSVACGALLAAFLGWGLTGGAPAFALASAGKRLISYGAWSSSHQGGIAIEFLVDRYSLAFGVLTTAIAGVVSAFSNRYLHREAGYHRYFVLLAMFVTGMLMVALAGNVAVLFVGWELVGLSSALLVAFFHERPASVANAFRVLSVYRISDAAMLAAAVLLRHIAGSDSLSLLFGSGTASTIALSGAAATSIALLLIVAAGAKSALLPFSSWLPRAMEGPTPSSAVYYGSLSIHAGCFLLLRAGPLLEHAPGARVVAGAMGLLTALFAGVTTRVQSDVKSSLAYASLTQVGLIVFEIALGWYTLAFVHLAGHACFRLLQFLSAPNVLHDLHGIESARGDRVAGTLEHLPWLRSARLRERLYLFALERGFLDPLIDRLVHTLFIRPARFMTRLDRRLCGAMLPMQRTGSEASGAEAHDE